MGLLNQDQPVTSWCQTHEQYMPLIDFFPVAVTCAKVLDMEEALVLEAVPPNLRMLAACMLHDMSDESQLSQPNPTFQGPFESLAAPSADLTLRLSAAAVSPELMPVTLRQGRVTVKQFAEVLGEREETKLDLSSDVLMDEDFIQLVAYVEQYMKKCTVVDVSNNELHGYVSATRERFDAALKHLVSLQWIRYVNICGNPFASTDRKDFFQSAASDMYGKLIWIPQPWLAAGLWKKLVNPLFVDTVATTHKRFYHCRVENSVDTKQQPQESLCEEEE